MRTLPGALFCAGILIGAFALAATADCVQVGDIHVDPALGNTHSGIFFGEAVGQTFHAEGPLIESISVWRVAYQDTNQFGMHIFVMGTDSLGRPDLDQVFATGPEVYHLFGNGVDPTEFEFVFNPPLRLPENGNYYLAIQATSCIGYFDLVSVRNEDHYPAGSMWFHGRSFSDGCPPRVFPQNFSYVDLAFRIRFCDFATPVRRSTWGEIKTIYR